MKKYLKIYHRDAITRFVSVLQIEFDVRHHGAYPRAKRKKKMFGVLESHVMEWPVASEVVSFHSAESVCQ